MPTLRVAHAIALTLAALLALGVPSAARAFDPASPIGLWRTLDEKTGRTQALIRLEARDDKVFARIAWTDNPEDATNTCTHCKDERKDAPIIGLVLIRNLERADDGWDRGDILDPRNGAVYRCKVWLEDEGRVLVVRGYIGLSLLGGSRRWYRAS